MHIRRHFRRLVAGIAVAGAAAVATSGPAHAWIDTDPVTLTDTQVSFGGSILGVPAGPGHVKWDIVSGYYTPRLMGTLSMNGASPSMSSTWGDSAYSIPSRRNTSRSWAK